MVVDPDGASLELAHAIASSRGLVLVVTGAGVSLASGIPTFRGADPGAVWKRETLELATNHFYQLNPVESWQWYRRRFDAARAARPNDAHHALAELERVIVGRGREFLLVTQNIDSLHEQAGSERLVKVHGSADRTRCSNESCPSSHRSVPISGVDFDGFDRDPRAATIPRCSQCNGLMRPHVLWFDEFYTSHPDYHWPRLVEACASLGLLLLAGTSLAVGVTEIVQDAAGNARAPIFIVDPGERPATASRRAVHLKAPAERLLPRLCRDLSLLEQDAWS